MTKWFTWEFYNLPILKKVWSFIKKENQQHFIIKDFFFLNFNFVDGRIVGNVIMLGYYESEFDWKNETNMVSKQTNMLICLFV